jgi:hypothetical protein
LKKGPIFQRDHKANKKVGFFLGIKTSRKAQFGIRATKKTWVFREIRASRKA